VDCTVERIRPTRDKNQDTKRSDEAEALERPAGHRAINPMETHLWPASQPVGRSLQGVAMRGILVPEVHRAGIQRGGEMTGAAWGGRVRCWHRARVLPHSRFANMQSVQSEL